MKASIQFLAILFILISATAIAAPIEGDSITVIESKHKNLFVFKANRSLIGSEVMVYHSNGELVTSMKLKRRKAVIDFCDSKFGSYTIKIVKDGREIESYSYSKVLILGSVIR
ncbi:MAG: hypothetical protein RIB47_14235 [Cyclobacteriaceae bacterium]